MPGTFTRAWIEINTTQLKKNINAIKTIAPNNNLALVVKANAYGHDLKLITNYCAQENLVDFFCVAHLSEALSMRTYGITTPILVMQTYDAAIEDALMYEIDLTISNFDQLEFIAIAAQKLQKKAHIHLKIDTGLSRFGFFPEQLETVITFIKKNPYFIICGLFSHFAQSQDQEQDYTSKQQNCFMQSVTYILNAGISVSYIHQQNSAGIITQANQLYNMMRIGALAYGIWSSDYQKQLTNKIVQEAIQPILSLKTRIIEIKKIPAGKPVGYNGIFITQRDTITAKIPIGYADGYSRDLGIGKQPTYVYIHNQHAPIIGHIAMNVITIDITDIPNTQVGDIVILIGAFEKLTPNDLSALHTYKNAREITVNLNPQIERLLI